ncbi:hypothetical protein F511_17516 [Dorcoceras hygrometricum]|uniref:Uncharacterized protein n=1 Tax=Dorcoceras hygrometricum TaxID=472368 RepID=A0A2Z7CUT7_9LAMI|nr:hypothetical protein F511_17516 [Dorcoceras hygrometricum]
MIPMITEDIRQDILFHRLSPSINISIGGASPDTILAPSDQLFVVADTKEKYNPIPSGPTIPSSSTWHQGEVQYNPQWPDNPELLDVEKEIKMPPKRSRAQGTTGETSRTESMTQGSENPTLTVTPEPNGATRIG